MPSDKEKIEEIFNIKKKTFFELKDFDNEQKILTLKEGNFKNPLPWFDDINNLTLLDTNSLMDFVNEYYRFAKENFDLKLEKSILKQFPNDFNDVWVVCIDEIKKIAKDDNFLNINFDEVVSSVKRQYPNLFINMNEFINNMKSRR